MQCLKRHCTESILLFLLGSFLGTQSAANDQSFGISALAGGIPSLGGGGSTTEVRMYSAEYEYRWRPTISFITGIAGQKASSTGDVQDDWNAYGVEAGLRYYPFRERAKSFHAGVTYGYWRGKWEQRTIDHANPNAPSATVGQATSSGLHVDLHAGYKFIVKERYYLDPALHLGFSGVSGHVGSIPYAGVSLGAGITW